MPQRSEDRSGVQYIECRIKKNSMCYRIKSDSFSTFRTRRELRLEFGLFGRSENSSFSSTLRAWFAIAHHRPTENPTGVTKKQSPCGMFPIPAFPKPGKGQIQSSGINPPHGTRAPKGNVKKYEVTYPLKSFIIN